MPTYLIRRAASTPGLQADWDAPPWKAARTLKVDRFVSRSTDHHPPTTVRLLYNDAGLYVSFKVKDRYVRCVYHRRWSPVNRDSCVEMFVAPKAGRGYFNLEINCGGAFVLNHVRPTPHPDGNLHDHTPLPDRLLDLIEVYHSMPRRVAPEIQQPVAWEIGCFVPFRIFEEYAGRVRAGPRAKPWRANFYKCADRTSHPHWASWAPLGGMFGFHLPQRFGMLRFG